MPAVLTKNQLSELRRQGRVLESRPGTLVKPTEAAPATPSTAPPPAGASSAHAEQMAMLVGLSEIVKALAERPTQVVVGGSTVASEVLLPFELRVTGRDSSGRMAEVAAFSGGKKIVSLTVEARDEGGRVKEMVAVVGDQVIRLMTKRNADGKLLTINARQDS